MRAGGPELPIAGEVRVGVSHLEGVHRGRVETFGGAIIRIGSGEACELRLEGAAGVLEQHATLEIEHSKVHLRPTGVVYLNGVPARERTLENRDLIEIGRDTRLRVRLLPDDMELPPRPPARRHSHAWALVALLAVVAAAGVVVDQARRTEPLLERRIESESRWAAQRRRAQAQRIRLMQEEIRSLKQRVAHRIDVDQRMGEVKRAVAEVESSLLNRVGSEVRRSLGANPDLIAARRAAHALERIIASHSPAVCLVQGAYGFGRVKDGKWRSLREATPEMLGDLEVEPRKVPLMLEGSGPPFRIEFTGTAFLVDSSGMVMTNRHIGEPWWKNDAARPLLQDGFEPRFVYLHLYFPGLAHPISCDLERTLLSDSADLALLRFHTDQTLPKPLPLAKPEELVVGHEVLLLGYPSGLNALLARTDESFANDIVGEKPFDPLRVLDALAGRGLIRPLPTHGHISDLVRRDKMLFDAPTAVGGSGGPLINLQGRVVGVNYGILKAFRGANFGVPVEHVARLIARAR